MKMKRGGDEAEGGGLEEREAKIKKGEDKKKTEEEEINGVRGREKE